jgi:hypothetical protein
VGSSTFVGVNRDCDSINSISIIASHLGALYIKFVILFTKVWPLLVDRVDARSNQRSINAFGLDVVCLVEYLVRAMNNCLGICHTWHLNKHQVGTDPGAGPAYI